MMQNPSLSNGLQLPNKGYRETGPRLIQLAITIKTLLKINHMRKEFKPPNHTQREITTDVRKKQKALKRLYLMPQSSTRSLDSKKMGGQGPRIEKNGLFCYNMSE